ncbi:flagella synthesis protein FlgN [Paraburkholderia sp. DHOC27]|uniref:flagella synthesis protein FlgN n=1 Tax=Paraburkholderia sp. DHOC27 TaxID=2303330 RepID=UPI000E3DD6D6|nr:flagellar protein FlgN [Paraburkholderia sp. DHOC27]RFU47501.1 flagellar protein FlgN [Paraburkholderia sp. DHOC27]
MKDALLAIVIDEYSTIEAFASVLTLEQKALTEVDPAEALRPIVEKKTELVGKLATLEKTRDAQLAEMGLPGGWTGIELASDRDPKLAAQWSLLQQSVERARRSNKINGVLIRTRMEYNQRALDVLQVRPAKPALYGPDGRVPTFGAY